MGYGGSVAGIQPAVFIRPRPRPSGLGYGIAEPSARGFALIGDAPEVMEKMGMNHG